MNWLRIAVTAAVLFAAVAGALAAPTSPVSAGLDTQGRAGLPVGGAEFILRLQGGNFPEGIAVDEPGDIYLGNRRIANDDIVSEILKVSPDGSVSTFAVLATLEGLDALGTSGVLGLATDVRGNVYAALVTFDPPHMACGESAPTDRSARGFQVQSTWSFRTRSPSTRAATCM
jgi:hypothetical protein